MEIPDPTNLAGAITTALCIGMLSGLLGCVAKWILEETGLPVKSALLIAVLIGAVCGSGLLLATDRHSIITILVSLVTGAIIPWLSTAAIFQSEPPPDDHDDPQRPNA